MHQNAEKLFYALGVSILSASFFVIQPVHNQSVYQFQKTVRHEFTIAATQIFGDQPFAPVIDNVSIVVSSINEFYDQSADAVVAAITPAKSEDDMFAVIEKVYNDFSMAFGRSGQTSIASADTNNEVVPPANFMQEDPVLNIVPTGTASVVSGIALDATVVNDSGEPWVNLRDIDTGQVYCVAIFNAEVNRYLGPCKNDYH